MAALVQHTQTRPIFRDDPHWLKFKAIVSAHKTEEAAAFLVDSYHHKVIEGKLDQYLWVLIDHGQHQDILVLSSAMRRAGRLTELARVARLGAAIYLNDPVRSITYRSTRAIELARNHGSKLRSQGFIARAAFMERIASS